MMHMITVAEIFKQAQRLTIVIPAFNVPYLPMVEPVIQAVVDQDAFSLVETARLEWIKFNSRSPSAVAAEFARWSKPDYVRLHLDHVPVIDEDDQHVDYLPIIQKALEQGYESVMVDGSRLNLDENIRITRQVSELAHAAGVPVEAELGAVLGHETGEMPSYEELFTSGRGFTDVGDAQRLVQESECDWLSVAIGNVHGAIAAGRKDQKKIEARLNLERLEQLAQATRIPLVLHGGSGIQPEYLRQAIKHGIVKINVGTEIRQPYERVLKETSSVLKAQQAVYERTAWVLRDFLGISGMRVKLIG
jgi:fructose-bisphosphate aldolase class II